MQHVTIYFEHLKEMPKKEKRIYMLAGARSICTQNTIPRIYFDRRTSRNIQVANSS